MAETIMALLIAIRCVESTDGLDVRANGNNYQITRVCVEDVNRIYGTTYKWPEDVKKDEDAQNIAFLYLSYYADQYRREYGRVPSKAVLARIYNRGYKGMKRGEGHQSHASQTARTDCAEFQERNRQMNCNDCTYHSICNYPNQPCIIVEEENA